MAAEHLTTSVVQDNVSIAHALHRPITYNYVIVKTPFLLLAIRLIVPCMECVMTFIQTRGFKQLSGDNSRENCQRPRKE